MAFLIAGALLLGGVAALVKGADWFTDGAGDLAKALGVSALFIGIVLAGLEPEEMLTAAIASGRGAAGLAVGNVIGTNVTILLLALGLAAVLVPIRLAPSVRPQAIITTVASVPPIVLLFLGTVSRLAGLLLLGLFVGYTLLLLRVDRQAVERHEALEALESGHEDAGVAAPRIFTQLERRAYVWRKGRITLIGLLTMAAGAPAIVEGALRVAALVGLRQSAIGLTIVSLGTGAEMVALAIAASRRGTAEILVGGIIGSFAYNLLVTLGLAATIRALPVDPQITHVALPVMIAAHLVLLVLVLVGRISRGVGVVLLVGYAAYLVAVVVVR